MGGTSPPTSVSVSHVVEWCRLNLSLKPQHIWIVGVSGHVTKPIQRTILAELTEEERSFWRVFSTVPERGVGPNLVVVVNRRDIVEFAPQLWRKRVAPILMTDTSVIDIDV